jgi:hypothetical protein
LREIVRPLYFSSERGLGMFPIRLLSPLVAIGLAGFYFLPETSGNILALARKYESKVPIVWETHEKIAKEVEGLKKEAVKEVEQVSDKLGITKK